MSYRPSAVCLQHSVTLPLKPRNPVYDCWPVLQDIIIEAVKLLIEDFEKPGIPDNIKARANSKPWHIKHL